MAFAFLTLDTCTLFIAPGRLSEADAAALAESGVALRGYDEFLPFLRGYDKPETVLLEKSTANYALYTAVGENPAFTVRLGSDPITALKGVKNETELANIRECHIRDGVAMVRF